MKYIVVESESENIHDFEKKVNDYLDKGWKLQGGVSSTKSVIWNGGSYKPYIYFYIYNQAMILDES